ncbi:hypothetical protein COLO4_06810 [Corchorus olitorius]|uniref:Uncharacterized protein n=1 Tax=Corchorus olitorius TaxID=93759 RepID=A0A1R3KLV0_9ROSI|nr:hypothetical protein COLO4_06810 [Corchorus olitorius]
MDEPCIVVYTQEDSQVAHKENEVGKKGSEGQTHQQSLTITIEELALQTPFKDLSGSPTPDQDSPGLKHTVKLAATASSPTSISDDESPAKKQKRASITFEFHNVYIALRSVKIPLSLLSTVSSDLHLQRSRLSTPNLMTQAGKRPFMDTNRTRNYKPP